MSVITRRVLAMAAAGSLTMATTLVGYFEGRSLVAYLDPVGIPTICDGITAGVRPVSYTHLTLPTILLV